MIWFKMQLQKGIINWLYDIVCNTCRNFMKFLQRTISTNGKFEMKIYFKSFRNVKNILFGQYGIL